MDDIEGTDERSRGERETAHVRILENKILETEARSGRVAGGDFPAAEIATAVGQSNTMRAQPQAEQTETAPKVNDRERVTLHRRPGLLENRIAAQFPFHVATQPTAAVVGTGDFFCRIGWPHDELEGKRTKSEFEYKTKVDYILGAVQGFVAG